MAQPVRLMDFVSESQDETSIPAARPPSQIRDRPLYEILKENKDKKDAEFSERFKHRPPKALDEDEMEFLEKVEMIKKEQEKKAAEEEARELDSFHAAIANRTLKADEQKPLASSEQGAAKMKRLLPKPSQSSILANLIKVKPLAKKSKLDAVLNTTVPSRTLENGQSDLTGTPEESKKFVVDSSDIPAGGLVAYGSDGSDEDDI